jgi:hypothetical protein
MGVGSVLCSSASGNSNAEYETNPKHQWANQKWDRPVVLICLVFFDFASLNLFRRHSISVSSHFDIRISSFAPFHFLRHYHLRKEEPFLPKAMIAPAPWPLCRAISDN